MEARRCTTLISRRVLLRRNFLPTSECRVFPSLSDCLLRPGDDERRTHEHRKERTSDNRLQVLVVRAVERPSSWRGSFHVAVGLGEAKAEARRAHVRRFSSSNKQEEKEKENKVKRFPASLEELPVAEDPKLLLPKKKALSRRLWSLLVKIGSAFKTMASMSREDWKNKLKKAKTTIWLEMQHYWVGTKLLWAEIRISTRLLLQLSAGKKLTRREHLQLQQTAGDIARLVPFIVIVIVPFMEFLLPVLLKVFPNMLPSTFQDKMKQEAELTKRLETRLQHAKSLKNAVLDMASDLKSERGEDVQRSAKDLEDFMNRVRTGQSISNQEILGFAKLFNDELTLDNISRPRLISMCKYMGLQPYGTDAYLRYALRKKLAWIKSDDRLIRLEGIDSLSDSELRAACRDRGMLVSLSPEEMKKQLTNWLNLSLDHSLPSSLLILSRAFVPDKLKPAEAVQATLSSLPDEVVDSVGVTVLPSEDTLEDRKRKLEFLKQQEKLIKQEQSPAKPKTD